MDEQDIQDIKNNMRMFALESLVCHLWATIFKNLPSGAFEKARDAWLDGARNQTFPGVKDAATSDLFAAELEAAVERLANMVQALLSL